MAIEPVEAYAQEVTAAVFAKNKYDWHIWTQREPHHQSSVNGKHHVLIERGHKIGFRAATSDPTKVRMIHEHIGPTKVFSMTKNKATRLKAKCSPCKCPTRIRGE